jgi:hypothetical protein
MIHLELTDTEAAVLRETIQSVLKDLSYEIADTDSQDFREGLKSRRNVLVKVEQALSAS